MLQERELIPLMQRLLAQSYQLMIETSGERPLETRSTPRSTRSSTSNVPAPANPPASASPISTASPQRDEVKFVITDRADYEFARDFIRAHSLDTRAGQILLSPAFSKSPTPQRTTDNALLDPRQLVEWMLADALPARLSLQIHKYVWEPQKKGV